MVLKTVLLCKASICRKLHLKLQIFGPGDVTRPVSDGEGAIFLNFLILEIQFTKNRGPAHKNGFHYRISYNCVC